MKKTKQDKPVVIINERIQYHLIKEELSKYFKIKGKSNTVHEK
jgi:hypothetical protein